MKDPAAALEHARRVVEENKRLRSELGKLRAGDRDAVIAGLVARAVTVEGVTLIVSEVPEEDATGLRELAQKVRDKLAGAPAVVVLGSGTGGKAQLVAASTQPALERGLTAPALLTHAAKIIGGGAGGKDHLAMAGGKRADGVAEALAGIPARLSELVAAR